MEPFLLECGDMIVLSVCGLGVISHSENIMSKNTIKHVNELNKILAGDTTAKEGLWLTTLN
jgi:hypothetical protein